VERGRDSGSAPIGVDVGIRTKPREWRTGVLRSCTEAIKLMEMEFHRRKQSEQRAEGIGKKMEAKIF